MSSAQNVRFARARHPQSWRPQLWLGLHSRGPLTATGIYQAVARRGRQCGMTVYPHRLVLAGLRVRGRLPPAAGPVASRPGRTKGNR